MSPAGPSPRRRYGDPPSCPWCAALSPPQDRRLIKVDRKGASDPAFYCTACRYEEIPPAPQEPFVP